MSDQPDNPSRPAAPARMDLEIRVRYAEVDQMGVLHHSRYWVYFEMGRTELLRRGGLAYRDLERAGVFFVVVRCDARFQSPARYDDVLVLTTAVAGVGAARIDHEYTLRHKGTGVVVATASTTLACVDRAGAIIPIPDAIRALL